MRARNFSEIWINWMHDILSTSMSAVIVNGCPDPWITCKKGLRQGGPISPYLFLLVAETLQCMIRASGSIQHPTEAGWPCVVLQYTGDTLIVLKGDNAAASELRIILDQFASLFGLHINYSKSTLVPIHMDEHMVGECVQAIGCRRENFP